MGENKSKTLGQSEGVKFDEGKDPWELLPWDAVERVVQVLKFGMVKYKARNWENGISYSRQFAATIRHLVKWYQYRQEDDHESSINHLAHAICDLLFILAYVIRQTKGKDGLELDDRPDTYKAVEVPYSAEDGYTGEEEYLDELDDSADDSYARDYVSFCTGAADKKSLLQTLDDASEELGLTPYADDLSDDYLPAPDSGWVLFGDRLPPDFKVVAVSSDDGETKTIGLVGGGGWPLYVGAAFITECDVTVYQDGIHLWCWKEISNDN